ncbi:hypothetical protein GINT2_001456 [Glugoides intestinalis]
METMVSSSNNIEQVIYLWQKLIWSKQPEGLLSTALFIEMSIAILFIITWLKEEEEKEKYYYNVLSGKMTILLVIISGIISGKGLEILFRTLYIWSGAYGNVVFSLDEIFISLLFGSGLVCFGYLLLFNKKLHKRLRLQKSEYAKLKEIMATIKEMEEYIKKILENIDLKLYELQNLGDELQNLGNKVQNLGDDPIKRKDILKNASKYWNRKAIILNRSRIYEGGLSDQEKNIRKAIADGLDLIADELDLIADELDLIVDELGGAEEKESEEAKRARNFDSLIKNGFRNLT